jgi:F-type H+-transporting ATPase subunit alpha
METEFDRLLKKTGEYGVVYSVNYPIVLIEGLPGGRTHEVIVFETGETAEISSFNRGKVEARLFSKEPVKVGTRATRTDEMLSIPVGQELLGQAINPLGEPLDPNATFTLPKEKRSLESEPSGIASRQKLATQMNTGIALIDLMIPLGKGQRELILGDRKTGKTAVLMTTMKTQIAEGAIVIYAAIAKKKSDIKKLQDYCISEKIMEKMVLIASPSYSAASLIYQTPYAAMTLAEYFRDQGQNTLVILDDLSAHAKCYRELSLLAKRFPGRGSYPGDIFYAHSSMLERAGNFKHPKVKEVSISCLPVIETVEGDLASYIPTNTMGITDGHIFLDSNIYLQGMRPAVNIPISVTRVGRQTLDKLSRDINSKLTAFISEYEKLLTISHFGQELSDEVKKKLHMGDLINKFFNQSYHVTIPKQVQLIIVSLVMQDLITDKDHLEHVKQGLINAYYDREKQKLLYELTSSRDLKTFNPNVLAAKDKLLALAVKAETPPAQPTPPVQTTATQPIVPVQPTNIASQNTVPPELANQQTPQANPPPAAV